MARPALPVDGLDLPRLAGWMAGQGIDGPVEVVGSFGAGTQNIVVQLRAGRRDLVLRRPPVHKRSHSDATMVREARVLRALDGTDVPHPRVLAWCDDLDVLGAAFYVMEWVDGCNATRELPPLHASDPAVRRAMGLNMPRALAAVGAVDVTAEAFAGIGRPEGFLERQVPRWRGQLHGYQELDGYDGFAPPGLDDVEAWLLAHRPPSTPPGLIHGDFHLANVLFSRTGPDIVAVVDWELTTVGDPLVDLGWFLAAWPADDPRRPGVVGVQPWSGFPTRDEIVEEFARCSPRDLAHLRWYEVLGCYKKAVILEGTHARARAGLADPAVGERLHRSALALVERAVERAGR